MIYTDAVPLSEVRKNLTDDLEIGIYNEFINSNFLMSNIKFKAVADPVAGGGGFTYRFIRQVNQNASQFRNINDDYEATFVRRDSQSVDLKIFGGRFGLDRVLAKAGGVVNELQFQLQNLISSVSNSFNEQAIIGDATADPKSFHGLLKWCNFYNRESDGSGIDLSSPAQIEATWRSSLNTLDDWISTFNPLPTFFMGSNKTINRLQSLAREVGVYQTTMDEWGRKVDYYDGIRLVKCGYKTEQSIDESYRFTRSEILEDGVLLAGSFGDRQICALSPKGNEPIMIIPPTYNTAGSVKYGEVEMVTAICVEQIESIGVLKGIKMPGLENLKRSK